MFVSYIVFQNDELKPDLGEFRQVFFFMFVNDCITSLFRITQFNP